jgi:hypothetical protein
MIDMSQSCNQRSVSQIARDERDHIELLINNLSISSGYIRKKMTSGITQSEPMSQLDNVSPLQNR